MAQPTQGRQLNDPSVIFFRRPAGTGAAESQPVRHERAAGPDGREDTAAPSTLAELEATNHELRMTIERLERLVYVDELTGLANRRCFDAALDSEIRRAVRDRQPLALFLCDIDRFKWHNDRFGHRSGDAVLRQIGDVFRQFCRRAGDCAARYGGEEFALILPQTRAEDALPIAEELRAAVAGLELDVAATGSSTRVTLSVGVTTFESERVCPAGVLIDTADAALYRAKNGGRNRIELELYAE